MRIQSRSRAQFCASNFYRAAVQAQRAAIPSDSEDDEVDSKDFQMTLEPPLSFMDVEVKVERIIQEPEDEDQAVVIRVKEEPEEGAGVTIKMEERTGSDTSSGIGCQEPDSTCSETRDVIIAKLVKELEEEKKKNQSLVELYGTKLSAIMVGVGQTVQLGDGDGAQDQEAAKLAEDLEEEKKKTRGLQEKLVEVYGIKLNEMLLGLEKKVQLGDGDGAQDAAKQLAKDLEEERKKNQSLQEKLLEVYATKLKGVSVPQGVGKKVGVEVSSSSTSAGPACPPEESGSSDDMMELDENLTSRTNGFVFTPLRAIRSKRYWNEKMLCATDAVKRNGQAEARKGRALIEEKFKETGVDFLKAKQERAELLLELKKISKDGDEIKQKMAAEEVARRKLDEDREKLIKELAEEREKLAGEREGLVRKIAEDRDGLVGKKAAEDREEVIRKLTEELEGMKKKSEPEDRSEDMKKLTKSYEGVKRRLAENTELLQKAVKMLEARKSGDDSMEEDIAPFLELQVDLNTSDWNDGAASEVASSEYEFVTEKNYSHQKTPVPASPAAAIGNASASTATARFIHRRMEGMKGIQRCSCGVEFASPAALTAHCIHEEPPKIKCPQPQCEDAFRYLASLNCHLKRMHKVPKKDLKTAHCCKCDQFFVNAWEKTMHKSSCSGWN